MARRRAKSHKSGSSGKWLFRLILVSLLGIVLWWMFVLYSAQKKTISHYTSTSHAFITSQQDNPIVLVITKAAQPAQLQSLAVLKVDYQQHSLSALKLPTDLSDGQTMAAEYLESNYYKELQQMVEQAIAMPITSYIIQPAPTMSGQTWSDLVLRQPGPDWWHSTVVAPWWLSQQPALKTNLSFWQLTKLAWLARDADEKKVDIRQADSHLFYHNDQQQLVADTQQLDTVVDSVLADTVATSQGLSVVVKNATDISGLATLIARYIHHLGGDVIAVEAADQSQVNSSMAGEKTSLLSQNISNLLGIPLTITPSTGRERSDMEIVVGVDILNRLGKPAP